MTDVHAFPNGHIVPQVAAYQPCPLADAAISPNYTRLHLVRYVKRLHSAASVVEADIADDACSTLLVEAESLNIELALHKRHSHKLVY